MFETGATYLFKMVDIYEGGERSFNATIIRLWNHLIEVRMTPNGELIIFNTAASTFISAKRAP